MPPKRKAAAARASNNTTAAPPPTKQVKQDGQKAVSRDLDIPLDEGLLGRVDVMKENPRVYIDDDGIIYDASLNQSNVSNNNNKFYRIQLVARGKGRAVVYCIFNRWGRVGEYGQAKVLNHADLDEARRDFHKKFKDKSGLAWEERDQAPRKGKYTFIQKSYVRDDDEAGDDAKPKKEEDDGNDQVRGPASKLPIQVQRLLELIFNENHFNSVLENIGYNQDKLPLGKLGESTIKNGFKALQELSSLIRHPSLAQNKYQVHQTVAIEDFTNQYYSTIPHIFGRARPPLINNVDLLQRETAMLDTLTDMEIASKIMKTTSARHADADSVNQLDQRFQQLNCDDVTPLDPTSREYRALQAYLINTAGHTHNIRYRLQSIFRVTRAGEADRFARSPFATRPDTTRRLLWHGSRTTNFAGILSQGLRIAPPEAPVNGYMFGKGVYLADISTKSANYCQAAASGGHGLLLLCEAELGNPMHDLVHADSGAAEKCVQAGKIATFGIGRTVPPGWIDAGEVHENLQGCLMPDPQQAPKQQTLHKQASLQYNEYICYDVAQIRIRYLLRFAQ